MNWMTSGRKRVQRSQKVKELRAKHFAKVAADRARALPQPPRAGPSTARQSADVSRLQSRWMQTSQVEHSGAPGKVAASVERTAASGTTPGHNTTERSSAADVAALGSATPEGEFQAGVLNLDVTPPLNASRSYYGASGARQTMSTDAVSTMRRTPSPTQVQHSDPSTAISQQKQQYQAPPSRSVLSPAFSHNALPVERRQLFFGTGGTAGEELGGTYEAQLRGGESEANALPNGTSFSHQHYNGTASAAVDQDEASAGQRTRFGQEKMGNPLRFFNSGVEVEHNGSPVPSHLMLPSHMAPTAAPPVASLSHDAVVDVAPVALGNTDATARVGRGMPSFSIEGLLGSEGLTTTPSEKVLEAGTFRDINDEADIPEQEHGSFETPACGYEPSVSRNATEAADIQVQGHQGFECQEQHTPKDAGAERSPHREYYGVDEEQQASEASRALSREETQSAAFELLARTWGLFGGALDAPLDITIPAAPSGASDVVQPNSRVPEYFQAEDECETQAGGRHGNGNIVNLQGSAMQHISLDTAHEPQQERRASPSSPTPNIDHVSTRSDSPELVMLWETKDTEGSIDLTQEEASPGKFGEYRPSDGAPRSCENRPVLQGVQEVDAFDDIHAPNQQTGLGIVVASADIYDPGPETLLVARRLDTPASETKPTTGMRGIEGVELELSEKLLDSVEDRKGSNWPDVGSGPGMVKRSGEQASPYQRPLSKVCIEGDAIRTDVFGDKAGSQGSKSSGRQVRLEERESPVAKTPVNASTDMEQEETPPTTAAPITDKSQLAPNATPLGATSKPNGNPKRPREVGKTCPRRDGDPAQGNSDVPCARDTERSVKRGRRQLNLESPSRGRGALGYRTMPKRVKSVGPRPMASSGEKGVRGVVVEGGPNEDDYSTVVWYRTIVACLVSAS